MTWRRTASSARPSSGPVSYTHLDVYKRQALHLALGLFGEAVQVGGELSDLAVDRRRPVSYTHLDVYKRQLQQMLRRALPLTVLQYRRDRLLVQRVRHLLRERLDEGATAETLAERLHLSPRTLHRQLEEEGASVQQLKDEARRERAVDLLNRTNRSVKQIALAVGFRNEKSFARAFRQWTGASPSAFRDKRLGGAGERV